VAEEVNIKEDGEGKCSVLEWEVSMNQLTRAVAQICGANEQRVTAAPAVLAPPARFERRRRE